MAHLMNPLKAVANSSTQGAPSHFSTMFWRYWMITCAGFIVAAVGVFLAYEFSMLAKGRPQDTLSAQWWRALGVTTTYVPISQWGAVRFLGLLTWCSFWFAIALLILWLTGHFFFGIWR